MADRKKMRLEILAISKKEYNSLCDSLRHLLTLSKKIDKRSDKLHEVINNLNDELREERKQLVSRVQAIETLIDKLILKEVEAKDES